MQKIYLKAKTIHRLFALVTAFLTLLLIITGLVMKYPEFFANFSFVNQLSLRKIHNFISLFAAFALMVMMITGLILYFYPVFSKKKSITTDR